jgi:hypothetical protein
MSGWRDRGNQAPPQLEVQLQGCVFGLVRRAGCAKSVWNAIESRSRAEIDGLMYLGKPLEPTDVRYQQHPWKGLPQHL